MRVAAIVPVFNEAVALPGCLASLREAGIESDRIVVVDGGSTDDTALTALRAGARVVESERGRAGQMNAGAAVSDAEVLWFVHADTRVPLDALALIAEAMEDPVVVGGCFPVRFDTEHPVLRLSGWLTRWPVGWLRFGDQGFFVRRDVFARVGGYPTWPILEDVEFCDRIRREGRFQVLGVPVLTSARRFRSRGVFRQQLRNCTIVALYRLGVPPSRLARYYR